MAREALYDGWCKVCGGKIRKGSQIEWSKAEGARHVECAGAPGHAEAPAGPISLSGGSGYGCQGWQVGQVILSSEKRRREGGPDALVIVTAARSYVREDGLSFGVGEDSGYAYYATARPATAEEMAPAIEAAHEHALAEERALEAKRLERLFESGEHPDPAAGQVSLVGDEVPIAVQGRIYGGGRWAVIEPEGAEPRSIWWVVNNGRDGDDWSYSNVRTGGAGAIGRRLPWSPELERRVRAVRER
jgi:hypothetical protein